MACHQHTQQSYYSFPRDLTQIRFWSRNHTTASSQRTPAGFTTTDTILVSQPHNSKSFNKKLLQVLQHKCNFGLATTQQQVLQQETSAGFNTDAIMVLQPHNSKLTKNSCRIYHNKRFKQIN